MGIARRALLLLAFAFASPCQELVPGVPVERTLRDGENHSFALRASAGQFVWLTVSPKAAADISLALFGPDGTKLATSAQRELFTITPIDGQYRISLQGQGGYTLTLRALRNPSTSDNRRVSAFAITMEAAELLEKRPKTAALTRQAESKLLDVLPIWRELGASNWEGYVGHELGNAYLYLQELPKAKTVLLDALPLRRATRDPRLTALTLSTVTIPRQSRGPSFVSRSKRLVGVAVAAPRFGATSTVTHQ